MITHIVLLWAAASIYLTLTVGVFVVLMRLSEIEDRLPDGDGHPGLTCDEIQEIVDAYRDDATLEDLEDLEDLDWDDDA